MKYPTMKCIRWQLRTCMIGVAGATMALVLAASPVPAAPTISASSNPVIIPNGQTSGTTTITWKAAPDYPYSEIYLSVDNAAWSEFARGVDASKPATIKLGSTYTFRMMIYEGQAGTPKVITTLIVTAVRGSAPPPASGPGGYDRGAPATRVGENSPGADAVILATRPLIDNVRVETGPRHILIRFKGPPNQVPYVAIGRAAPVKKDGEWVFGDNLVGGGFVGPATVSDAEKAKGEYTFASAAGTTISNDGLEPGATYHYIISVPARSGQRPYQDTGSFTLLREATTVRVVWDRVLIVDDSDDLTTGEIRMWFWANYGHPSAKAPDEYYNRDADSGRGYDIHRFVVINNAPNTLTLEASGEENDGGFTDSTANPPPISRPDIGGILGSERNVATETFDLSQYPGNNATVPFVLHSMPNGGEKGDLRFEVFGFFEITRGTEERTGTTGSGLSTAPEQPPLALGRVKLPPTGAPSISICESARRARARNSPAAPGLEAQCRAAGAAGERPPNALGRVKLPPTGAPPISICDSARAARARNSPAAPGLEARCRASYAATGASIAESDPVLAAARVAEADVLYGQGFDIATAIFGDPALGARGNTATGPGSLGIRDALGAAGQRGFNAAVKLHLSRNYIP